MKNKAFIPLPFICIVMFISACQTIKKAPYQTDATLVSQFKTNLQEAGRQYKYLMQQLPEGHFPKTYHAAEKKLETSGSDWWCSGFYPGTLFLLFEETGDNVLYKEGVRMLQLLEGEKNNRGTHDLGFMMFCSYGQANRIAPQPAYNPILLTSAASLATRYNPIVGCIKSWNSKPTDFLVIIDNMMNLELLFWATRVSGDSSYYKLAVQHANTTITNHFRPDYSSYHVVNYHPENGTVQQKRTAQGFADESAWARGQAWGLYGFVATYRGTGDKKYLEQAKGIANFLLSHPNLPADKIPYWDFNAPNIPGALRDASAAAIMASALLELCRYTNKKSSAQYFTVAETMLRNLSTPAYKATIGTNGGFILQHGVGHLPQKSEVDVPLTYADYYYVEGMKRYIGFSQK